MTADKWTVEITRSAERQIKKLGRSAQKSILAFLRDRLQTARDPRQFGKVLSGDFRGLWWYRVGDYRLICDIRDEQLVVLLLAVGHRGEVYK